MRDAAFWRKRWDSNPRAREGYLISSQGRYDRFDTLPYDRFSLDFAIISHSGGEIKPFFRFFCFFVRFFRPAPEKDGGSRESAGLLSGTVFCRLGFRGFSDDGGAGGLPWVP